MKEFNNRDIAKKNAEYITGKALRRYVAGKVKEYVGDKPTVFDGACGSGQLEEFVNAKKVYGVEIQEGACEVFKENYPKSEVSNMSFFNYKGDVLCDCVIMNPPFSLKFKERDEEEQANIKEEFPWKKSGVVDDIFVLKSLKYTKRYGFYILFPGLGYRNTEKKLRELIGYKLKELNLIHNAFEDTQIAVLFIVIDKEKEDPEVKREIYDCKNDCQEFEDTWEIEELDGIWEQASKPEEKVTYDPVALEIEIREKHISNLDKSLATSQFICSIDESLPPFSDYVKGVKEVVSKYE